MHRRNLMQLSAGTFSTVINQFSFIFFFSILCMDEESII